VREGQLLTLEEAVRKMTGLAASTFGMQGHGVIAQDMRANVVIFDAQRVSDLATFDDPIQYSAGIEYVIVGGRILVSGGMQHEAGNGVAVKRRTPGS
jgi:N-acyl-D-aspartate/D-glutamate deacylase